MIKLIQTYRTQGKEINHGEESDRPRERENQKRTRESLQKATKSEIENKEEEEEITP